MKKVKVITLGDAIVKGESLKNATEKYLGNMIRDVKSGNWVEDSSRLQEVRLRVENNGPENEEVDELILKEGKDAEILASLFLPISSKVFDAMPNLKIAGVARYGTDNVNVDEATKRGILIFNVVGRNIEATSDYTVGLLLAECRNIARAHYAIKNGEWRKKFSNYGLVPDLKGKKVGIIGFGAIGKLVSKKLSGFDVERLVYDPFISEDVISKNGCIPIDKETLFKESDFITIHVKLTEDTKNLIGENEINLMKKSAYLINTGRADIIDKNALVTALKEKKIAGAGLDVLWDEPLDEDDELLKLDNVTLTSHIAGMSSEALSRSPYLLMEDIGRLLNNQTPRCIVNKEVLNMESFKKWFLAFDNN